MQPLHGPDRVARCRAETLRPTLQLLWRTRLAIVFPGAGLRRNVHARLELFQRLRNRVAHHDNILFQPVESIHTGMVEVAGYIDPDAPAFFSVISRVPKLLATKP